MKSIKLIFFLFVAVLATGCNFTLAADVTPPPGYQPPPEAQAPIVTTSGPIFPLVPPDPAQGESIYAEKCAPCHGATGMGDGPQASQLPNPVSAFADLETGRQARPSEWFNLVTNGSLERFMPPFKSLTDRQRWDVVAYALALSASQPEIAQGRSLYEVNCAGCHGEQGQGDGPDASSLTASPTNFTDQRQMAEKSKADFFAAIRAGVSPAMPAHGEEFSETEIWNLASYIRSLSFAQPKVEASIPSTPEAQITQPAETTPESAITSTVGVTETAGLGTITGAVINASGGSLDENIEVILHGFDQMNVALTQTVPLAADGTYIFENVEMPEGRIFLTTVEFEDITYGSEVATVGPEPENFNLPIEIFETTSDLTVLSVDRLHFFFEFLGPEILRVVELYIVSNPTQKTVIAEQEGRPVLSFTLPKDATNLEIQDGEIGVRYVETEDGFGDTISVRPGMGNYQVLFSYEIPYGRKLELKRKMLLPVNAVVILAPENGLEINGDNLQDAGTRDVQGVQYHLYNGNGVAAGEELHLSISGRMVGETPNNLSDLYVGLGALGVVLIVAGIWLYRRNGSKDKIEEDVDVDDSSEAILGESAETIMDAILTLDDLYRENELPEEAYIERRNQLKERLRQVLDQED